LNVYNEVPTNSPIFASCYKFDITEVQRLFKIGLASPFDLDEFGFSLIDRLSLWVFSPELTSADLRRGLDLLAFLVNLSCPRQRAISSHCMDVMLRMAARCRDKNEQRVDALRLLIGRGSESPFDDVSVGIYASLAVEKYAIFEFLKKQDIWEIEWNCNTPRPMQAMILENDRQMLSDPMGERLLQAIAQNQKYAAIVPEVAIDWGLSPLHSLLRLAKLSKREEVKRCCEARMSILLRSGCDARLASRCAGPVRDQYPKSPTNLARSLGVLEIWVSALSKSGWANSEIQELLDDELYLGVPQLVSGDFTYRTQAECREDLIKKLSYGYFAKASASQLVQMSKEIGWNIGVFKWGQILETIREANSVYLQKSMPGSWPEHEEFRLIPRMDFTLPQYDSSGEEINWADYMGQ
jgi:hypothetical protein